jgi:putative inorganic carbon (hco3(-)) transporter
MLNFKIMRALKQITSKTLEYSFYILLFFTPLVLWPQTSEVFELNKMLFVYLLTIIITSSQLIIWTIDKKIILRRTPLDLAILLFLISQIFSTIFSIHPHTSFFGYYSRWHGSLLSTTSYIFLYYIYINNFHDKQKIKNTIYSILGSSLIVATYAILEKFGIDKDLWVQDVQNRVFSSLGQPNWLAAYLLAIIPLPIYLFSKKNYLYLITFFLLLISIIFTKSQSGLAALVIILTAISFHLGLKHKKIIHLTIFILTSTTSLYLYKPSLITNPLISLNKINPFYSTTEKIAEEDLEQRGNGGSDSMAIRRIVWDGAINLGLKYPFFGTGVETFAYSYYQTRPNAHNLLSEWDFLYNKAHNEYLNIFATTGFLGIITYLLLITYFIIWFFRSQLITAHSQLSIALFLGFLSILITNFFGFSVVIIGLYFFIFPSIIIAQRDLKETILPFKIPIYLSLPIITIITYYLLFITYAYWQTDIIYNSGKNNLSAGNLKESLDFLEKAHLRSPNEALYTASLAQAQAQAVAIIHGQLTNPEASLSAEVTSAANDLEQDLLKKAEANINTSLSQNQYHTTIYKTAAASEIYLSSINPQYTQKALNTLLKLNALAPTDAKVIYNIGLLYDTQGNKDEAKIAYQKALEIKSNYDAARERYNAIK